jgi:hypothetical protein
VASHCRSVFCVPGRAVAGLVRALTLHHYGLGRERGFISIDFEWLMLTLGKAGTVENAAVITD